MKKLFLISMFLLSNYGLFAQFSVNSSGDANIPNSKDLYIGNFGDANYRMRFTNNSSYSIIDYNPDIYFRSANVSGSFPTRVIFKTNGYVGINTTTPSELLHVNGEMRATAYLTSSDSRLKKNVASLSNSLTKISDLKGIKFNYNSDIKKSVKTAEGETTEESIVSTKDNRTKIGFSAQDVQKVFPELVYEDENGYLSVDYMALIPVLVEAIKEQQVLIEKLSQKVK